MNVEVEILKFLSEKHVIPKKELFEKFSDVSKTSLSAALNSLKTRGLISIISPMGPDTIVVTKKGLEEAEKI